MIQRITVDDQLTPLQKKRREEMRKKKPLVYEKSIKYGEKVLRGESIASILIQYDYKCNMRCEHCSISTLRNPEGKSLDVDAIKSIANQADALGLAQIILSGGEPLLFDDLEQVVSAINPERFYIELQTNGWLLTPEKCQWLKKIGIDKVQISIDSADEKEHDDFRRTSNSFKKAIEGIGHLKNAGLFVQIATVINPQRLYRGEFVRFLELMKEKDVLTNVIFPKLVGEWERNYSVLLTDDEKKYVESLESRYNMNTHLSKQYGINIGCLAVKRSITITQSGDVLPCHWMYFSLGNIFDTPLQNILKKGMRYFRKFSPICLMSDDREFIDKYVSKTWSKKVPIPIEEVMGEK